MTRVFPIKRRCQRRLQGPRQRWVVLLLLPDRLGRAVGVLWRDTGHFCGLQHRLSGRPTSHGTLFSCLLARAVASGSNSCTRETTVSLMPLYSSCALTVARMW